MEATHELDTSGMSCPLPILKLKKAAKAMQPGDVLRMVSTDAGSTSDVKAYCGQTGNTLVDSRQDGNAYIYYIQKS